MSSHWHDEIMKRGEDLSGRNEGSPGSGNGFSHEILLGQARGQSTGFDSSGKENFGASLTLLMTEEAIIRALLQEMAPTSMRDAGRGSFLRMSSRMVDALTPKADAHPHLTD